MGIVGTGLIQWVLVGLVDALLRYHKYFLLLSLQTAQGMAVFVQLGEGHWGLRRALEAAGRVGDITESWDY